MSQNGIGDARFAGVWVVDRPVTIIMGSQWGDEGKGKLVDILSGEADIVARCQGGNNAGHTVVVNDTMYDFHLIPSGLLHPKCMNIIGNGVVVHLPNLFAEMDNLRKKGLTDIESRLLVSERAHIVFDLHQAADGAQEAGRGSSAIGTTRKGIGPAYSSKATRNGLRMSDLISDDVKAFEERYRALVDWEVRRFPELKRDVDDDLRKLRELADRIRPLVRDTVSYLNGALRERRRVLVEGANACLLDIDFGTYPHVTSSNASVGGALTGLGIPPQVVGCVLGVTKAYTTRVGGGAFPTELTDSVGEHIQTRGREWGVTTGRKRRCGWLDLVVVKYSHKINGYDALCLTKLDILDELSELRIGARYTLDGKPFEGFPADQHALAHVQVEYITVPGWKCSTSGCKTWEELPEKARLYVDTIERELRVPVRWVGVGQDRGALIERLPNVPRCFPLPAPANAASK